MSGHIEMLLFKLNVEAGVELKQKHLGVIFSARNKNDFHRVPFEAIDKALNLAGYFEEDGDFDYEDTFEIADEINDFTPDSVKELEIYDKQIWFD